MPPSAASDPWPSRATRDGDTVASSGSLAAHLARDRRRAIADGVALPERATGAVLFADVSGFTPLTEQLVAAHGPRLGAERLSEVLDRVLGRLVTEVARADGSVVYVSGDAITVWLDGDDGRRGVACADRMQTVVQRLSRVDVAGSAVRLGLKVAVAAGTARRFVVGDPTLHLIDVLAGQLLDEVAAAEAVASPGDVVVTPTVLAALPPQRAAGSERSGDGSPVLLGAAAETVDSGSSPPSTPAPITDDEASVWVEHSLRTRLASGDGAMVAELRNVVPLFVDLGSLDFARPDAPALLDAFVTGAQRVLAAHGGSLQTLTVGDKGAYAFCVFGTPVAHEDDPARAVAGGLAVVRLAAELDVAGVRVGIARGRVFSGVQGHATRRTFVCLGDAVNLAARIMGVASPGEVVVAPEVVAELGPGARVRERPPVMLKGRSTPVVLSVVEGVSSASLRGAGIDRTPLVGRDDELAGLVEQLTTPSVDGPRAVAVLGVAGAGKSRLVREVVAGLEAAGRRTVYGDARAFGGAAAYQPWRPIWRELLDVPEGADGELVVERLAALDDRLVPRAPLLGPVLGLQLPDTELTRGMDPRVAKESREDLLVRLLGQLGGPPRVLVIDDAHAADRLSMDLVTALTRAHDRLEDVVVLAGRPTDGTGTDLTGVVGVGSVVELGPLDRSAVDELLDHHARLRLGASDGLHPAVRAAVVDRAQGNPLAVAELVRAVVEQGVDPSSPEAGAVELPASLEALVLGRVDRLPDRTRRVVKVGSVMVAGFSAATLAEVHPGLGSEEEIERAIGPAIGELLAVVDDGHYDLRHTLTREVAYSSLPHRLRRRLHRAVAGRVERIHADDLQGHLDELAHHAWHGHTEARERWTAMAAERAAAVYANEAALTYLGRLAEVAQGTALVDALLSRGQVLTLLGELDGARADQLVALEGATEAGDEVRRGRALTELAETARRAGSLDDATALLGDAEQAFVRTADEQGRARVLHLTGTVQAMRGDLDGAGTAYRSALAIRDRLGDDPGRASLMSNLGIVAEYDGNLPAAASRHAEALALRERVGDPWAIANSRTNLGMIALLSDDPQAAKGHFEAALVGNEQVGDPWHVALGRQNLGNALRDLGQLEAAARRYGEAARHFVAVDDDWAVALLLEDAARLEVAAGDELRAAELLGGADAIRDRLDAPRATSLEEAVAVTLAAAAASVGRAAVDRAVARGRDRDRAATLVSLVRVLEGRGADTAGS